MACLNSHDCIAYPGFRYTRTFKASTGADFRSNLADCLANAGWDTSTYIKGGFNNGIGYTCTSRQIPWCFESETPDDFKMKCRVKFQPRTTFTIAFLEHSEFFVMNESESMVHAATNANIRTTTGSYSDDAFYFVGNPYQFFVFMLGSERRKAAGISDTLTGICAGVPQVPRFLQARGNSFCTLGIQECFFLWNIDLLRQGPLRKDSGGFFAGGIAYNNGAGTHGSWVNTNTGTIRLHYGVDGGNSTDKQCGVWIPNLSNLDAPSEWKGLFYPPIVSWKSNPLSGAAETMKGFLWDCVVVNKGFTADNKLQFDGHQFIVVNSWDGSLGGDPAGALLLATSGVV